MRSMRTQRNPASRIISISPGLASVKWMLTPSDSTVPPGGRAASAIELPTSDMMIPRRVMVSPSGGRNDIAGDAGGLGEGIIDERLGQGPDAVVGLVGEGPGVARLAQAANDA